MSPSNVGVAAATLPPILELGKSKIVCLSHPSPSKGGSPLRCKREKPPAHALGMSLGSSHRPLAVHDTEFSTLHRSSQTHLPAQQCGCSVGHSLEAAQLWCRVPCAPTLVTVSGASCALMSLLVLRVARSSSGSTKAERCVHEVGTF